MHAINNKTPNTEHRKDHGLHVWFWKSMSWLGKCPAVRRGKSDNTPESLLKNWILNDNTDICINNIKKAAPICFNRTTHYHKQIMKHMLSGISTVANIH